MQCINLAEKEDPAVVNIQILKIKLVVTIEYFQLKTIKQKDFGQH
jgi:hypothetical protein